MSKKTNIFLLLLLPISILLFFLNHYFFSFLINRLLITSGCNSEKCWAVTATPGWLLPTYTITNYLFIGLLLISIPISIYGLIILLRTKKLTNKLILKNNPDDDKRV